MTKVLIVYATDYGNTKKMADVIASGVTSVPGTEVEVKLLRSIGEHMEQTGVTEQRLEAAKHHGTNVARVAAALAGKELFAK